FTEGGPTGSPMELPARANPARGTSGFTIATRRAPEKTYSDVGPAGLNAPWAPATAGSSSSDTTSAAFTGNPLQPGGPIPNASLCWWVKVSAEWVHGGQRKF